MTSRIYLQTGKAQLVDATEIVPHSELLNELKETYDDEPIEVMVGDPATVYQQTLDAVDAIKMLYELTTMLNEFNHPAKPEDRDIPLGSMKKLHDTITTMKSKWLKLSTKNPVYDWLFPNREYTMVVKCTTDVYSYYCDATFPTSQYNEFRSSCENEKLEVAKWLVSLGEVDIHAYNDSAFRWACQYGHLEVAKWLVSLGGVDIHAYNEQAFRYACEYGYLGVAKWLVSLGGVDIHAYNEFAFRWSCRRGHLEVVQWLVSLGGVDIHAYSDNAYRNACVNGYLKVSQWLVSLGGVDIHAENESAFR
jgi:hypothetical protein